MIGSIVLLLSFAYLLNTSVSFEFSIWALIPAIVYCVLNKIQRPKFKWIFLGSYSLFLLIYMTSLLDGFRVILNEIIIALAKWDVILPYQETSSTTASIAISFLLVLVMLLFEKNVWSLLCCVIVSFVLLQQPIDLLAFGVFMVACILAAQLQSHRKISIVPLAVVTVICIVGSLFQTVQPIQDVGNELVKTYAKVRYGDSSKTRFINGQLQNIKPFDKTATPAFKIVMEKPRAMYLKSFVGTTYRNNWYSYVEDNSKNLDLLEHLKQSNDFEQTQFSQATRDEENETVSIQTLKMNRNIPLVPYELASSIEEFSHTYTNWQSNKLLGTESYTYKIDKRKFNEYPTVASEIYTSDDVEYRKLEAVANYLSYSFHLDIPQEERVLLQNHFEKYEHKTYEQTIKKVIEQLSIIEYNEKASTSNINFVQSILEDQKEGYSVHYATLATLLFRFYGVPARYIEGYIITNEDIKDAKAFSELVITSDSRHAWTEIYVDWLGWIPIEVTPGYAEKMPRNTESDFVQDGKSNVNPSNATGVPTVNQLKDPFLQDEPPADTVTSTKSDMKWLVLLIILFLIVFLSFYYWWKYRKVNLIRYRFLKLIRYSQKKLHSTLPVHQIVALIDTVEVKEAYELYNTVMYQTETYNKKQLKEMKRLIKIIKKQIKAKVEKN